MNDYTVSQPNRKVAVFHGCNTNVTYAASYDLHLADQMTITD